MHQSLTRLSVARKLLLATSVPIALIASASMPPAVAPARADPIGFPPDWPYYEVQTEQTMCAAMAQGWSRAQIIGAAQQANDFNRTGMSPAQAGRLAGMWVDPAHIKYCPGLNAR